jgi:hypothetical protein
MRLVPATQDAERTIAGFLHSLPVPEDRFKDVAIDFAFVNKSPEGNDMIMIIVDRLTKYTVLIPCRKTLSGEGAGKMLMKHWFCRGFGAPSTIVSDRDPRFVGKNLETAGGGAWESVGYGHSATSAD